MTRKPPGGSQISKLPPIGAKVAGQIVDDKRLSQRLARQIARRGLQTPALVALEAGRPLAFVAGQLVWVAQPVLSLLWPRQEVGRVARLLETPDGWERLIQSLEREGT